MSRFYFSTLFQKEIPKSRKKEFDTTTVFTPVSHWKDAARMLMVTNLQFKGIHYRFHLLSCRVDQAALQLWQIQITPGFVWMFPSKSCILI